MQQTNKAVFESDFLHQLHCQLIVIGGNIGSREDRSQFMLSGSYFVMLGFGINAELPEFFVQIFHEIRNSLLDIAEIMIFQFLTFRRLCAE